MRQFFSYGPVDVERHFTVPRRELVSHCLDFLVGEPDKGGHYFTIWAPRQTGKTWLMRQVMQAIAQRHGDRFQVATMSMQGVVMGPEDSPDDFLDRVPHLFRRVFKLGIARPSSWEGFS